MLGPPRLEFAGDELSSPRPLEAASSVSAPRDGLLLDAVGVAVLPHPPVSSETQTIPEPLRTTADSLEPGLKFEPSIIVIFELRLVARPGLGRELLSGRFMASGAP